MGDAVGESVGDAVANPWETVGESVEMELGKPLGSL